MPKRSSSGRRTSLVVGAGFAAIVALYLVSASRFFAHVEDALISYTYARNFAEGYGFVPVPGGERVEGFSNPLWVFLLALGQLLGASPFVSSRALGIVLAAGSLWVAYALYRDHLRDEAREPGASALLAPAMLACMPGFQMWNHMGLENPLYGFLLLSAAHLHLHELRDPPRFPASAFPMLGLLLTRPEAPLYVACILGHKLLHVASTRREDAARVGGQSIRLVVWCAIVAVPFAAYVAWRIHYFAWPLPTSYYTKLATKRAPRLGELLGGEDKGLLYLASGLSRLRMLPLLALGCAALVLRRQARGACALLATLMAAAAAFAVYSGGDWMQGWRWLHILTLPLAPLAAAGLVSSVDLAAKRVASSGIVVPRAARVAAVAVGFALVSLWPALVVAPALAADLPVLGDDIHARLDHMTRFADAFEVDDFSVMDGDQGALTYFGPPRVRPIDVIGLNDVSTAQNFKSTFRRPFFHEYFFERNRPTFYHARLTPLAIPTAYPEWSSDYTILPGYSTPREKKPKHGGWMRKDVFRVRALPDDLRAAEAVTFECGLVLRGARVRAPVVDVGAPVRVEAYWQAPEPVAAKFDYFVELTLVDETGKVEARVRRPVLHQAYAPGDWRPDEILRDPEALASVAPGDHAVTLAVFRALHAFGRDIRTEFGAEPVPIAAPEKGLQACPVAGNPGPLTVAHVRVDPAAALATATELSAIVESGSLAEANGALARLGLVLGPGAARVQLVRGALSARVKREELREGERLLQEGKDREAAEHLLRARREDVRAERVNELLAGISGRLQASATARVEAATSRAERCSGFRELLEAVEIYPPNARARRQAEQMRPQCWSVLSELDFGEVGEDGALVPETTRRVFPPGQELGLRARWRETPNLRKDVLPLEVRVYGDDGRVAHSRTVRVTAEPGEATVAWKLDEEGPWRFEAWLEGRLEASVTVVVRGPGVPRRSQ